MSTIAAIATPLGDGALGVIRISGEDAIKVADRVFFAFSGHKLGELQGYIPDKKALDNADIEEIQNHFDNSLAKEGRMVIDGVQSQYGADLIELKEYLKGYHPFIWNDVKDNWGDTFKNSKIEVYVKTNIRRIGVGY